MKPRFSVITSVLDEAPTIEATLASVESQTMTACGQVEHILIDGGSTDGSLAIMETYARQAKHEVRLLRQTGKGIYQALNQAIDIAQGEIISILHANDVYTTPDVLSMVSRAVAPDISVVYGDAEYMGDSDRYYSARRFGPKALKCGLQPPHPSMFVTKKTYDEIGTFNTIYSTGADFDFCVRVFLASRLKTLYLPVSLTRLTPGGISATLKNRLFMNNVQKYMALRRNGFKVCPLRLAGRYFYLFDK